MALAVRRYIFWSLIALFFCHSFFVFTSGTENDPGKLYLTEKGRNGKLLFQKYNCSACHQLYGLGGYMGPDLTNIISAEGKGELYARAFLKNGTERMPDFNLSEDEIASLVEYLRYTDKTGISPVRNFDVHLDGTVSLK